MQTDGQSTFNLVVLGATPAGIAAALAAARLGQRVLLLERTAHVGGLPANGLGITDIASRDATGGVFQEFIARIRAYYLAKYGAGSSQVAANDDGYRFEPHVAEQVLEAMLAEQPLIVVKRYREFAASARHVVVRHRRLTQLTVTNLRSHEEEHYTAGVFVDATYEGDLMAAAGVPFRVGRESAEETGEPGAGRIYYDWITGRLQPGSTGEGDAAVQAYNYRLCLTRDVSQCVPIERPADYRREDYLTVPVDVKRGRLRHAVYRYPRAACFKPVPLPNEKWDANDHPKSLISTDLAEENWAYPTSDWAWRDRFAQRLRDYELGLLWFCQHDPSLPASFREDALQWGLPASEFGDNGHFPRQLYVREARRMEGEACFTALDCIPESYLATWQAILAGEIDPDPDALPPPHAHSITAIHYPLDSHACHKREPGIEYLEGYFAFAPLTRPYQVPYGVIVPKQIDGLLVPVACSATHLGFSTLRMEPCWMALGQAAGVAAHLALSEDVPPRQISVPELQKLLRGQGAVLHYAGVT